MQAWVSTGVPVHPAGVDDTSDRVCVLFDWQVPHAA
jgi:hypothetical protein